MIASLKQIPRNVWIVALTGLINRIGMMVLPFLILYLMRERGFTTEAAGAVIGLYGLGAFSSSLIAGWVVGRIGNLNTMMTSLVGSALVLITFPLFQSTPAIIVGTFVLGAISEIFRPSAFTVVSLATPAPHQKVGFAVLRWAINLGWSIGPALGGYLVRYSFSVIFIIDSATSLLAAIVLWLTFTREDKLDAAEKKLPVSFVKGFSIIWHDRPFTLFLFANFVVTLLYVQHDSTLAIFTVQTLGLTPEDYGLLFTINGLLILIAEMPLNAYSMQWSHRWTLLGGTIGLAIGFGGFYFCRSFWDLAICVVVFTFGEMIMFPAASAHVADASSRNHRALYMGAFGSAWSFSGVVGPPVGAFLFQHIGARMWLVWGVVGLVGAVLLQRSAKKVNLAG